MRSILPFAFDTFYEGLQLGTKVCVCIWLFAMGKRSVETGIHFWTPFLTRVINERRRLHPGIYGNIDRYQMWPQLMMDTGDFIGVLSSKFKPSWKTHKNDLRHESFRIRSKRYISYCHEHCRVMIIQTMHEKKYYKNRITVHENENFRFESRNDEQFILQCKFLKDVIGCEVFEFKAKKTSFHDTLRLKRNEHDFTHLRWDYDWKTIELVHSDGWTATLHL